MTAAPSTEADFALRTKIVEAASAWIGTPYQHQASCLGVGADCLGLVRGVWRELYGREPERVPAYSADWSEVNGNEALWMAMGRHLVLLEKSSAGFGDVALMRMREGSPAKHVGFLLGPLEPTTKILHAYSGHAVCCTTLGSGFLRRVVAAFRFPAIERAT